MMLTGQDGRQEINQRFARHVSSGKAEFFAAADIDFIMGQRQGLSVADVDGAAIIDLHCNGGVFKPGPSPSTNCRGAATRVG